LSMLMGEGSWLIFLTRPLSLVIFLLTLIMFCWPLVMERIRRKQAEMIRSRG
jgi:TctA family transporter